MIDIQIIRDNAEWVAEKAAQKGYPVDVKHLLALDSERLELLKTVEALRQRRNAIADSMKGGKPEPALIEEGKAIKVELASRESYLAETEAAFVALLKTVPNMPLEDVPVGSSEDENVVAKTWGEIPAFDFEPRNHWQIAESRGLIDKERAGKVSGSRFAYVKGDLVQLQFAVIQWVLMSLSSEALISRIIKDKKLNISSTPFVPVLPPAMIKTEVFDAMDRLEPRVCIIV